MNNSIWIFSCFSFGNEQVQIWSGLTRTKREHRKCKESWQWNDNTTYTAELYEEWWTGREPSCGEPLMRILYSKSDDSVKWGGSFSHSKFHCVCEKNMSVVAEPIKYGKLILLSTFYTIETIV